jgi:ABC-type multidrug transport system fused ATPase/permease subunit
MKQKISKTPKETSNKIPDKMLPFLWFFVKQRKLTFFCFIFLEIIFVGFVTNFVSLYLMKCLINGITNNSMTLYKGLLLIFGYAFCDIFYIYKVFGSYLEFNVFEKMRADIRVKLFAFVLKLSTDFFNNNFSGELNEKINSVLENFENVSMNILGACRSVVLLFTTVIAFSFINKIIGITLILMFIIFFPILLCINKTKNNYDYAAMENELQGIIGDSFLNISAVKSFSREDYERHRIKTHANKTLNKLKDFYISLSYNVTLKNSLLNFFVTSALMTIIIIMFLGGNIKIDTLIFLLHLTRNITFEIQRFGAYMVESTEGIQKIKSGMTLLSSNEKITDRKNAVDLDGVNKNGLGINSEETNKENARGKIMFKNVSFSYPTTKKKDNYETNKKK